MISAGTKIVCPICKEELGRVARPINMGDVIVEKMFDMKVPVRYGDPMLSKCCGAKWLYGGSLSTENGWLPPVAGDPDPE